MRDCSSFPQAVLLRLRLRLLLLLCCLCWATLQIVPVSAKKNTEGRNNDNDNDTHNHIPNNYNIRRDKNKNNDNALLYPNPKKTNPNHKRNNILLLLTDDQDIALGSFDTAHYMPIVHKQLKHQGITFEQGALVHVPICCPSRSSLLTGKYLHHGNHLAKNNSRSGDCYSREWKAHHEDKHTLAVHAQAAGYTTLYAGKYLNQYRATTATTVSSSSSSKNDADTTPGIEIDEDDSIPKGWDYWYGLEGNSRYYNYTIVERRPNSKGNNNTNKTNNFNATVLLHKHGDSYPADYLPLVLEEYTLSVLPTLPEPWLAIIAWPTPHGPFTPEPQYSQKYPTAVPPRAPDYNATESSQQQKHWLLRQLGVISNTTAATIEAIYRDRLRALKTVDNHVGKLLQWLETETEERSSSFSSNSSSNRTPPNQHQQQQQKQKQLLPLEDWDLEASPQWGLASEEEEERRSLQQQHQKQHQQQQPMIDRTVIIYTSDNGFQFGQHRLSIDKRHLYEHDVRVPFVVRGPKSVVGAFNVTLSKETIVSTIDIAPTVLEIVLEGIIKENNENTNENNNEKNNDNKDDDIAGRLRSAINDMDGLSFWGFLKNLRGNNTNSAATTRIESSGGSSSNNKNNKSNSDDPFVQRTDLLISYHGEGNPKCGLSECPAPLDGLWWMPDSYNNTYHCVRTLKKAMDVSGKYEDGKSNVNANANPSPRHHHDGDCNDEHNKNGCNSSISHSGNAAEDSIYCVFYDDEDFVEYYDLNQNPHQLGNNYKSLSESAIENYERRLQELLS